MTVWQKIRSRKLKVLCLSTPFFHPHPPNNLLFFLLYLAPVIHVSPLMTIRNKIKKYIKSLGWIIIHYVQVELEFRIVGFCGGRKTGESGERYLEQRRESTTNTTHIWSQLRDSNPGHNDGRRTLSPVCHLSPINDDDGIIT